MSEPTNFLRWRSIVEYRKVGGIARPVEITQLEQFWIVRDDEEDITIAKDVSPDGLFYGRWREVPQA